MKARGGRGQVQRVLRGRGRGCEAQEVTDAVEERRSYWVCDVEEVSLTCEVEEVGRCNKPSRRKCYMAVGRADGCNGHYE